MSYIVKLVCKNLIVGEIIYLKKDSPAPSDITAALALIFRAILQFSVWPGTKYNLLITTLWDWCRHLKVPGGSCIPSTPPDWPACSSHPMTTLLIFPCGDAVIRFHQILTQRRLPDGAVTFPLMPRTTESRCYVYKLTSLRNNQLSWLWTQTPSHSKKDHSGIFCCMIPLIL